MTSDYRTRHGVTETIDGLVYTNTKLPTSKGLEIIPLLISVLGEDLMKVIVFQVKLDPKQAAAIAMEVAKRLSQVGIVELAQTLVSKMKVNQYMLGDETAEGGPVLAQFDAHFAGEYQHLANVLMFSIRHNFQGPTRGSLSKSGLMSTPDETVRTEGSRQETSTH